MPSTTSYQAGDLVLVAFPFTGGTGSKLRPALVLLDSGDADILVARMTTEAVATPYDVSLTDWRQAGVLAPSAVRLHKLATLEKVLVDRVLGCLEPGDRQKKCPQFFSECSELGDSVKGVDCECEQRLSW